MINRTLVNNKILYSFNNESELLELITDYKGLLIAMGAEKILNDDKSLIKIINKSITYCDGYGAVYALKRKGIRSIKIPGAYFWLKVVEKYYKHKTFYFLGSKSEVITKTISLLENRFKGINIVGYSDGFFEDDFIIKNQIKKLKPDIVFCALGSPRQEYFMSDAFSFHNALYMGLGGSFDLFVGNAKNVPEWWNKIFKWEGLYRTLSDVTNIKRIKRQKVLFKYLYALLINKL